MLFLSMFLFVFILVEGGQITRNALKIVKKKDIVNFFYWYQKFVFLIVEGGQITLEVDALKIVFSQKSGLMFPISLCCSENNNFDFLWFCSFL